MGKNQYALLGDFLLALGSLDLEKLTVLCETCLKTRLATWHGWNTDWWLRARKHLPPLPGEPCAVGLTLEHLRRISPRNWSPMGLEGSELSAAASPCAYNQDLWPTVGAGQHPATLTLCHTVWSQAQNSFHATSKWGQHHLGDKTLWAIILAYSVHIFLD